MTMLARAPACELAKSQFLRLCSQEHNRKNWLFASSPVGSRATAVMYSLVETAKENGQHPYHYLEHLLSMLPNATSNDLTDLLPWSDTLPDKSYFPQKEYVRMPKKGLEFMMEYVREYLDGEIERLFFDLDFTYI